ncbi:hypothetical protein SAMN05444159_5587 [Bradyrhizobium lablabi]|uniref:Uncharacterized protein n=1 Tax=Bradyrhizobium lablabi TaxID=722472 RepID=A0A1M6ZLS2_9BRAD|nr:hypothetical protein [Bradyrhizobium lablabi]SHL31285.1 hypothetical protein SAMN05444159_5587 [Bradyrhizobium lablabi]
MPSDPNATRVRIAFFLLVVITVAASVGVNSLTKLGKQQQSIAARETQETVQGVNDPNQIDEALRQHPANKSLQLIAATTKAANETSAAMDELTSEIEPPAISKNINLGAASRSDLEALRRDLKTAEANATSFIPRYAALLKTERDTMEKYALSLHLDKDTIGRFSQNLDKRHAEITAFTSRMLPARADYYRAYENYVAVLAGEFGTYRVVNGEFIFPLQRTVDRYNVAANAMTVAAKRIAQLEEERKNLSKAQQERWQQFVNGK